ncbi:MAG: 3-deoxy-7-phosphoheptulonate synthase class II [Acidobacteriota bacterium]
MSQPEPNWAPDSWKDRVALQQPTYPDVGQLQQVLDELTKLPPLVTSWEVESLREQLAKVAQGNMFLLQGGDCAEIFSECESSIIASKLKILLQMSLVISNGSRKKVVRVGRFAGQYAKPRSKDIEEVDGIRMPSYRGDSVNSAAFESEARRPDPQRLLRAYERSALTLNFIRSLVDGGFADLHHPEYWNLGFVAHSPQAAEYQKVVDSISHSLNLLQTLTGANMGELQRVDFFTSHEGLHLPYEQAQTRRVPRRPGWYNLTAHMPWIGDRTRDPQGAHVEYFRGISNPIGMKVGPTLAPDELARLLEILNPRRQPGRITLIHRFGAKRIEDCLPPLIQAVRQAGQRVVWCCDPMHGNTRKTSSGIKTRNFRDILSEVESAFEIHSDLGTYLGGVHCELTGENVTECLGGARDLKEEDLQRAYKSCVDPRLNYEQALELAFLIARRMEA